MWWPIFPHRLDVHLEDVSLRRAGLSAFHADSSVLRHGLAHFVDEAGLDYQLEGGFLRRHIVQIEVEAVGGEDVAAGSVRADHPIPMKIRIHIFALIPVLVRCIVP